MNDIAIVSALLQKRAAAPRLLERTTVDPDAVSCRAVVMGFRDSTGTLVPKQPASPNTNATGSATWYKLEVVITEVLKVPDTAGVRLVEGQPGTIELNSWVEAKADVKAYYKRQGEGGGPKDADIAAVNQFFAGKVSSEAGGEKAPEQEGGAERATTPASSSGGGGDDKKSESNDGARSKFQKKNRDNMTRMWVPLYGGMLITFNLFDTKKAQGLITGAVVDIEGLSAAVTIYMPRKSNFSRDDPTPRMAINYNTAGVTYLRKVDNPYSLFDKIPKMRWSGIQPRTVDVEFDVAPEGKPQDLRTIHGAEIPQYVVIPTARYLDFPLSDGRRAHIESLVMESASDLALDSKEKDDSAQSVVVHDGEAKQAQYSVCKERAVFIPYKKDLVNELKSGEARPFNIVTFMGNFHTRYLWGCARASTLAPVMAVMPPIPATKICKLDSKDTLNNKYNVMLSADDPSAGNVFFRVMAVANDLYSFLGSHAFHPSLEWLEARFKHCRRTRGNIVVDLRYPYSKGDPFHDKVVGASPQRPELWSIVCINNFSGDLDCFIQPDPDAAHSWQLCVLTSQHFASAPRHTKRGENEQDAILREIGQLSPKEADACLDGERGAKFPIATHATTMLLYFRRVANNAQRVVQEDEGEQQQLESSGMSSSDDDNGSEASGEVI